MMRNACDLHLEAVARKVQAHVSALEFDALATFVDNADDLDVPGTFEKRHGVGNGPHGRAASVPADHDVIKLERWLLI